MFTTDRVRPAAASLPHASSEVWVIVVAILASSMAFIDATALNVALPKIQLAFSASGVDLLWIVNAYGVVTASLILTASSIGDRYGRRRVFSWGIAIFVASSVGCGMAPSSQWLIASRALQGIGAALMIPSSLALIADVIPAHRRGRAIGTWSACSVIISALGPVLGGMLADAGWWRAIFWINMPLGLAAFILLWRVIPTTQIATHKPLNYPGTLLLVVGLIALNVCLISLTTQPITSFSVMGSGTVAMIAGMAFVANESRSSNPLFPPQLPHDRTFRAAALLTIGFYSALYGMLFLLALNLVQVQRYTATQAGLAQLPIMGLVILLSPLSGRLVDRFGPLWPLAGATVAGSWGFLLLAYPGIADGIGTYKTHFLSPLLLLGIAMGLAAAPLSTIIVNSVSHAHLGIASGINSTLSRLANMLGVAVLGSLAIISFRDALLHRMDLASLSPELTNMLQTESIRMLESRVPGNLPAETSRLVERILRDSFVDAFRLTATTSAVVVCVCGSTACWLLRGEKR
jgi:EmrB/QacA subfamily drug resistance transporter